MRYPFCLGAFVGFVMTCGLSLLAGMDGDTALLDAALGGLLTGLAFRQLAAAYSSPAAASWIVTASPRGARFAAETEPQHD